MNRSLLGGLGLIGLLIALAIAMNAQKEQLQTVDPAMESGFRAANTANLVSLKMACTMYGNAKGHAPEKTEDLVPEFLGSIPNEACSKSSAVVAVYDGLGGWVLDGDGFRPNHPQTLSVPQPSAPPKP